MNHIANHSTQRINHLFQHQKAMIAYLTAGDGGLQRTEDAILALIEGGINLLEIGIPFSDPVADGPVIQEACTRSLTSGTTLEDILDCIAAVRNKSNVPMILFTYLNPLLAAIKRGQLLAIKRSGVDGLLVVDCPFEESQAIRDICQSVELLYIDVIAPTTSPARLQRIQAQAQGFLYYACRTGVTGVQNQLPIDFKERIRMIKSMVNLPVVAGFGISTPEACKTVLAHADGVVIGSYFVNALSEGIDPNELTTLVRNQLFPAKPPM